MHDSTIVLLINDEARAIEAKYEPGGAPEMFKTFNPSIAEGDVVVVETNTRHGFTTAKVTAVDVDINFDTSGLVRWIVGTVDTDSYEKLIEEEKVAVAAVHSAERRRKKEALRNSMFEDHEEKIKALSLAKMSDSDDVTE